MESDSKELNRIQDDGSDLTLREAQASVDDWIKNVGVRYFSELTNLAQLVEEVGELARIISRTYGDQSFKDSDRNSSLKDELADILFVLICLANQTGIDLQSAFDEKMKIKTIRDHDRHHNNPKLKSKNAYRIISFFKRM